VGALVRSTCGIFVDAANPQGVEAVYAIKGAKRAGKPLSVLLYARALVPLLDLGRIRPDLRPIFGDPAELASRLATLCFMRVPITEGAALLLPPVVVSETPDGAHWLQNYVPGEWGPAFPLVDEVLAAGLTLPSATSMNVSGQPEIVDQDEALAFCAAHGIPLFLADPGARPVAKGSYPIISVGLEGVRLVREGHFPGNLFDLLLQTAVDASDVAPARSTGRTAKGARAACPRTSYTTKSSRRWKGQTSPETAPGARMLARRL
jgi:hypothetical protein